MTALLLAQGVGIAGRLQATDLQVAPGQMIALVGPNGGGKTSLLRALADVERSTGSVRIAGESLTEATAARRPLLLSFLPASRELVWPIVARDVIGLGSPIPIPQRVQELIQLFELTPLADRPINSLSTGERARVLLARALAPSPSLLLLDEPLSNLDPYWVLRILEILRAYVSGGRRSVILALHDLDQALGFDRVLLLNRGRLLLDGMPADVLASEKFSGAFRVERCDGRWSISRPEGPPPSP